MIGFLADFRFIGVGQHWANWRWRTCHIHQSHNAPHHPVSTIFYIQYQYPVPETGFSSFFTSLTTSPSQTGFLASTSNFQSTIHFPVYNDHQSRHSLHVKRFSLIKNFGHVTEEQNPWEETAWRKTVAYPNGWTGIKPNIYIYIYWSSFIYYIIYYIIYLDSI